MSADTRTVVLALSPRAAEWVRDGLIAGVGPEPEATAVVSAVIDEIDDQLAGGRHPSRPAEATLADLIAQRMADAGLKAVTA